LVGATRFELATPCTPCKCATRLRHAPTEGPNDSPIGRGILGRRNGSAAQDLDELFEFEPHLVDQLLALVQIDLCIVALEAVASAPDRKSLLVEQAADLANDQHVLTLEIGR